eukprot:EC096214.1.p1 GENE.EC096214.1~~EC096214.1.p1  ORF type:complete len:150 (+),score=2.10 EC096214.1:147-596(+)
MQTTHGYLIFYIATAQFTMLAVTLYSWDLSIIFFGDVGVSQTVYYWKLILYLLPLVKCTFFLHIYEEPRIFLHRHEKQQHLEVSSIRCCFLKLKQKCKQKLKQVLATKKNCQFQRVFDWSELNLPIIQELGFFTPVNLALIQITSQNFD